MGKIEDWAKEQEQAEQARVDEKQQLQIDGATETFNGMPLRSSLTKGKGKENCNDSDNATRQRTITITEPSKEGKAAGTESKDLNTSTTAEAPDGTTPFPTVNGSRSNGSKRRRRRGTTRSSHRPFHHNDDHELLSRHDAEELLKLVQGSLVVWPYDWLAEEEKGGGWLYPLDTLAPLEIYN